MAWCGDRSILGQPFAVTGWIEGVALDTELPASYPQGAETIDRLGIEMMRGLATVHALDWRELLPADFGRPDTFVQRQVERWLSGHDEVPVRAFMDVYAYASGRLQLQDKLTVEAAVEMTGLSQRKICRLVGVSAPMATKWKQKGKIPPAYAKRIIESLGKGLWADDGGIR